MATRQKHDLASGWKWRMANANGQAKAESLSKQLGVWTQTTTFPSVIQMELMAKRIIPDFNVGENERLIQWVGYADWEYACSFKTPAGIQKAGTCDLVLEGLDTFATLTLNGQEILKSNNMFIPQRVDVKSVLNPEDGPANELVILFESTNKKGLELEAQYGKRKKLIRDTKRMHIRKAQYHFGWDWGPIILAAGPYLPVFLDVYTTRVDDVHVAVTDISEDHSTATVTVTVKASGAASKTAEVQILGQTGTEVHPTVEIEIDPSTKTGAKTVNISQPKLWWPNGQGEAYLHIASVTLLDDAEVVLDKTDTRFGIRTVQVIQRPLDKDIPGKTFMFNVNGRDIFCQGANWIPADMLLPSISRERYFNWIQLAQYNHLNMLRVWGGGIYEPDAFWDACDEMGILVWYDFAFSDGDYPVHHEYLDNVQKEVEIQTIKMRNRASLAILCGNNEEFLVQDWLAPGSYDYSDHKGPFPEDGPFPQRKMYLLMFPEICGRLAPQTQYWPSSPWGDAGKNSGDLTVGDVHQWEVWHLDQKPYQKYRDLGGRFVSEFGMHGYPIMRTVDVFAPNPEDRFPQSRVIDCHNKGHGAETRIARYMSENFRYDMKFENFIYCSHLLQSEAYMYALKDWKRKFGGRGKEECAGALIWQLNDVYPVTSWAYIDYFLRPKPAFYSIRRNTAPVSVGVERTPRSRWFDEDQPNDSLIPRFDVFAHNTSPQEVTCKLEIRAYDIFTHSWTSVARDALPEQVTLLAGQNTELGKLNPDPSWTEDSLVVLEVCLVDNESSRTVARYIDWPEPYRYLVWPVDTTVTVSVESLGQQTNGVGAGLGARNYGVEFEDEVTLMANYPVKGCWAEPIYDGTEAETDPEPLWEDNMVDLLPGKPMKLKVKGLKGRQVHVRYLSDWEVAKSVIY